MKSAAFALALRKRVDEISVREIVDEAGVSRQVFYEHFKDRDDAVASAVIESLDEFESSLETGEPAARILGLFRFVNDNRELYRNLYLTAASERISVALQAQLYAPCTALAEDATNQASELAALPSRVLVTFLVGGFLGLLRDGARDPASKDLVGNAQLLLSTLKATVTRASDLKGK
jgi:AcrR family transcriptional regulator